MYLSTDIVITPRLDKTVVCVIMNMPISRRTAQSVVSVLLLDTLTMNFVFAKKRRRSWLIQTGIAAANVTMK